MDKQLLDALSRSLNTDPEKITLYPIRRREFDIMNSSKKKFFVSQTSLNKSYFLSLTPVTDPQKWSCVDLKKSIDILDSLKLNFSQHPKVINYFRTNFDNQIYDAALMEKEKGYLIHDLFHHKHNQELEKSLQAFGRALAEIHLKKIQVQDKPAKEFRNRTTVWLQEIIDHYEKLQLSILKAEFKKIINKLHHQAHNHDFLTGIIHYDPHPYNLMYQPSSDKLVLLDIDKIHLSINKKGKAGGPIALDLAKAVKGIQLRLLLFSLPNELMNCFDKTYKKIMGKYFPHQCQLHYYIVLEYLRTLYFISKITAPSSTQLQIKEHAKGEFLKLINHLLH